MILDTMLPRVLVIEDDGDLRRLLRRGLEEEGFEVVQASLGKDAVALAEHDPPDLLVVDIGLPDADGRDVIPGDPLPRRRVPRSLPDRPRPDGRSARRVSAPAATTT